MHFENILKTLIFVVAFLELVCSETEKEFDCRSLEKFLTDRESLEYLIESKYTVFPSL